MKPLLLPIIVFAITASPQSPAVEPPGRPPVTGTQPEHFDQIKTAISNVVKQSNLFAKWLEKELSRSPKSNLVALLKSGKMDDVLGNLVKSRRELVGLLWSFPADARNDASIQAGATVLNGLDTATAKLVGPINVYSDLYRVVSRDLGQINHKYGGQGVQENAAQPSGKRKSVAIPGLSGGEATDEVGPLFELLAKVSVPVGSDPSVSPRLTGERAENLKALKAKIEALKEKAAGNDVFAVSSAKTALHEMERRVTDDLYRNRLIDALCVNHQNFFQTDPELLSLKQGLAIEFTALDAVERALRR